MSRRTDVAIVGAGPVGLFAVFQCGMLGLKCQVIDALPEIGGQCTALYPEKPIYDIPGFSRIGAAELVENLRRQAEPFSPVYHCDQRALQLSGGPGAFQIRGDRGLEIEAGAVILAAGAGAFGPNRPPLPGIEAYEGGAVQYLVRDRGKFAGKALVIAGGGDSAVDWALALHDIAEHIYMVHRRNTFRATPDSVARLHSLVGRKLSLVVPYQLDALEGDGRLLTAVIVRDLDGAARRLEAQHLLAFFGLKADLGAIADWNLDIRQHQVPVQPATCATIRPGIYAIGDIARYPGKLKLILTGFAEAAMAAHAIFPLLRAREAHFEYSTSRGPPGN